MHKGAYSLLKKIVKGEFRNFSLLATFIVLKRFSSYVDYCTTLIAMLLSHNIKPIMVLDSQILPTKLDTEIKRRA